MATTITSITGLQNLTNLQEFTADWTSLQTVDLSGLTQLTNVDVSDTELADGSGTPSLTSINLTGCTALEQLRLDDSDFSAGIPSLAGLTNLTFFDMDQCGISGAVDISGSSFNNLTGFDFGGNEGITSITLPEALLNDVSLHNNALTEESVNYILQWLDGSGVEGGYVDLSGGTNANVTGDGITAKTNLEGKGWTVSVNQATPNISLTVANTSNYFDIPDQTDFTVEWFEYLADDTNHPRSYSFGSYFSGGASHAVSIENGTFYWWVNGSILISNGVNVTNGWHHFCIQRTSGQVDVFVDGSSIGSTNYLSDIPTQGKPLYIGSEGDDSLSNALFSNFRWNNTSAVYNQAGFTPPTAPLTSVAGTTLLLFQGDNLELELTDNSGLGQTINNGTGVYNGGNPFGGYSGSIQFGTL